MKNLLFSLSNIECNKLELKKPCISRVNQSCNYFTFDIMLRRDYVK